MLKTEWEEMSKLYCVWAYSHVQDSRLKQILHQGWTGQAVPVDLGKGLREETYQCLITRQNLKYGKETEKMFGKNICKIIFLFYTRLRNGSLFLWMQCSFLTYVFKQCVVRIVRIYQTFFLLLWQLLHCELDEDKCLEFHMVPVPTVLCK